METEKIEEMPNFSFIVIDNKTGKEADVYNIALKEDWAKGLIYCDMEGFAIEEEGNLILLDECGNVAYCPSGRFTVIPEGAVVLTREEYAELNITGKMYNEAIEEARKEAEDCSKKLEMWKRIAKGCAKELDRSEKIAEDCYKELEKSNEESDKLRDENKSLRKKLADAHELENLNAYLYQDLQNARKETAEKIVPEIKKLIESEWTINKATYENLCSKLNELAKQFGVEI